MLDEFVVDFPTLFVAGAWIESHCVVPDGFAKGKPFGLQGWQAWCTLNHYRVKVDARWVPERPLLSQAFFYRRSQVVAPQKTGKGPWSAAMVCNEAVGPSLFAGWAGEGDFYECADHGCGCGWSYEYEPGEAMGMPRPTPLIQLTASSDDQTDNVYRPLQSMIRYGALADQMLIREGFIRLPNDGKIDTVTSSALSRLGNPVTHANQDETGLYTTSNKLRYVAETQRRGLSGMGGRSIETTNAWDPAQNSVAQSTYEGRAADVFKFYRVPPKNLSYRDKRERRKIHEFVYKGSPWVDLDAIEAEAAELMETDAAQAERFYGNRVVQGSGAWLPEGLWESWERAAVPA